MPALKGITRQPQPTNELEFLRAQLAARNQRIARQSVEIERLNDLVEKLTKIGNMPTFSVIRALIGGALVSLWQLARHEVLMENPNLEGVNSDARWAYAGRIAAAFLMNVYGDELQRLETDTQALVAKRLTSHPTVRLYDTFHVEHEGKYNGKGVRETLIDASGDRDSFNTCEEVKQGMWSLRGVQALLAPKS